MAIGNPVARGTFDAAFNGTNQAVALTGCTPGTTLFMFFRVADSTTTVSSVTDDQGNSWTLDVALAPTQGGGRYGLASGLIAAVGAAGALTVTVHYTATGNLNRRLNFQEVSGLLTTTSFDKTANSNGFSGTISSGATAALSQAAEIAFGFASCTTGVSSWTPTGSWLKPTNDTVGATALEYQIVNATTALTATGTFGVNHWDAFIATYKGAVAPVNSVAPVVSGTTTVGSTLSTTNGTWVDDGSPTFSYQWQRDNFGGGSFSNISSATASTYVLVDADDGCKIRCVVTDTDSTGAVAANSNQVGLITEPAVPSNTVAPAVTGTTTVGQVLSTTNGTWTRMGGHTATYAYQWQRDVLGNGVYANIASATASSYTLVSADDGCDVRCAVTGTNTAGSASANSNSILDTTPVPSTTVVPIGAIPLLFFH